MTRVRPAEVVTRAPTLAEIKGWPATVDVPLACRALGVSRSHGYDLLARGAFPAKVLHIGATRRVVTSSLIRLLDVDAVAQQPP